MIYRKDAGKMGRGVLLLAACAVLGAALCGCSLFKPHCGDWRDATVDAKSGNVIAWWLVVGHSDGNPLVEDPVVVGEDYAMYIEWGGRGTRFFLYDNVKKKYFASPDFEKFLAALDEMPEGITFVQIDTCTVSRTHRMPAGAWEKLAAVMQAGNRSISCDEDDYMRYMVCDCESRWFRYPAYTTGEDLMPWRDALIDEETGKTVVMWLSPNGREEAQLFDTAGPNCAYDYAMFIVWQGDEKRFYIFDNVRKKYLGTPWLGSFLAAIEAMPEGITIAWIDGCQAGFCAEMPEYERQWLAQVMEDGDRKFAEDYHGGPCTCEATGHRYLDFTTGDGWREAAEDKESGHAIAWWMHDKDGTDVPAVFTMDYGMCVVWNETDGKRFYLYDNYEDRYFGTSDFDAFLAEIRALPPYIKIQWLLTCLVPMSMSRDMPDAERVRLDEALKDGHREWTWGDLVCTCSSMGFKFPDLTQP